MDATDWTGCGVVLPTGSLQLDSVGSSPDETPAFYRLLIGRDTPDYLALWTRRDRQTMWLPAGDLDGISEATHKLAATDDVYFGVGLHPEPLGSHQRGGADHVSAILGLWDDIDVAGPAHKRAHLPPTIEAAEELLRAFPVQPTLIVLSGHGLQPWWLLKQPWLLHTPEERQRAANLVRRFQATLHDRAEDRGWDLDSTHDLARVLRPPGTWNRKLDPAVPVRLSILDAARRYDPSDFEPYLLIERSGSGEAAAPVELPAELPPVDVTTLDVSARIKRLIHEGRDAEPARYPSRSEAIAAAVMALVRAGYDDATIAGVILDPTNLVGSKARERERSWLAADIGRARIEANKSKSRGPTQATQLVGLAEAAELFHTPSGEAFATVPVGKHGETWPVRSKGFRRWLSRRFYESARTAPSSQALQDALGVLEGRAQYDGPERAVYTRVAEHDGAIYLDLANDAWEAVEITPGGWRILADPPVRFRRAKGMLPLPHPETGGSLEELRPFLNVADEDRPLVVGWLIGTLRPRGPYSVLIEHGEQGSAKSTAGRVLRSLVDPNTAALRAEPREGRDLMIAATNGWLMAFDNLSHLPPWLSDALCRLATGGGFATRELYANDEEVIFDAQRPVLLNGIEDIASRSDLLDRAIVVYLPNIPEDHRRPEAEFWAAFEAARPRILGALLDAVSAALRNLPQVKLERLPRMADFALWVVAAEPALGWEPGTFLAAYARNRDGANELGLEASPVAVALRELLATAPVGTPFPGTATEWLGFLSRKVSPEFRHQRGWPKNARALSNALRRLAPNLRAAGIDVRFPTGRRHGRQIVVEKLREFASTASPASPARVNTAPPGDDSARPGDASALLHEAFASPPPGDFTIEEDDGDAGDATVPRLSGPFKPYLADASILG